MQKTDLPYYVTNFFTVYLPGQKNLSKNTIASYAVTFKLFFTFCKDKKDIQPEKLKLSMIDESLITAFLDWLDIDLQKIFTENASFFADYCIRRENIKS